MIDWDGYHKQLLGRIGELGKRSPDTLRGYKTLGYGEMASPRAAVRSLRP